MVYVLDLLKNEPQTLNTGQKEAGNDTNDWIVKLERALTPLQPMADNRLTKNKKK